ncbi:MAG: hypothetical protein R2854_18160 [Caldilineaceae bacterium]
MQKLRLLDDSMRFEPAGSEPRSEDSKPRSEEFPKTRSGAPKPLPCISQVSTPTGKKPVLKAMMTTACERNRFYCPFRWAHQDPARHHARRNGQDLQHHPEGAGQVDGLFLSSGIIKGSVGIQDQIIATAEILRRRYRYRGYIHLKIMPGAGTTRSAGPCNWPTAPRSTPRRHRATSAGSSLPKRTTGVSWCSGSSGSAGCAPRKACAPAP